MSATTMMLSKGEMLRIDANPGLAIRVRGGNIWLTRHKDTRDYVMKSGESMPLGVEGAAVVTALQPTLLELYRADPAAVRQEVERRARRARAADIHAFFARLFA